MRCLRSSPLLLAGLLVLAGPWIITGQSAAGRAVPKAPQEAPPTDWPRWRGPNADGVADGRSLPVRWGREENVRWSVRLPGWGTSSPVVRGNRVFVTSQATEAGKKSLLTLCFDRRDGKELWRHDFGFGVDQRTHEKSNLAVNTPAATGDAVYVAFGNADIARYSHDGQLVWVNRLTAFDARTHAERWRYGEGAGPYNGEIISSPVYGDGMVYLQLWRQSPIHAIRLWGGGRPPEAVWVSERPGPVEPSLLYYRGLVYALMDNGVLACLDGKTGKEHYRERLGGLATLPRSPATGAST